MAMKKGKGKGKGGKKCAIVAGAFCLTLAACKTVPTVDPETGELDGGSELVPDTDAITATGTAVSTLLPPPWNLVAAALFGSGGVAAGVAAYQQGRRKGKEESGG